MANSLGPTESSEDTKDPQVPNELNKNEDLSNTAKKIRELIPITMDFPLPQSENGGADYEEPKSTTSENLGEFKDPRLENISPVTILSEELSNFRAMQFHHNGNTIIVAGMGHPKNNPIIGIENVLEKLKLNGFNEMISLDKQMEEKIENCWVDSSHFLHKVFVNDYAEITLEQSLNILNIIKIATENNRSIVIHCGEGWGRTGSALATICLMLLLNKELKAGEFSVEIPTSDQNIRLPHPPYSTITTPLVRDAIMHTRLLEKESINQEDNSVENEKQTRALEEVEKYLRRNIKEYTLE